MTIKDLAEGLSRLAEDVETVDIRPQVYIASARLRARRIAGTITAAACSLLLAVVLASTVVGGIAPEGSHGQDTASALTGDGPVAYYLREDGEDRFSVLAWSLGTDAVAEVMTGDGVFGASVAISPDGNYVAYYTASAVVVAELATGAVLSRRDAPGDVCLEPSWYPDSSAVYVADATEAVVASAEDGFQSWDDAYRPTDGCHARYVSFGGDISQLTLVYPDNALDAIHYVDAVTGEVTQDSIEFDAEEDGFALKSAPAVSPDGRFLCVATGPADAGGMDGDVRTLGCDMLTSYFRTGEGQSAGPGILRGLVFPSGDESIVDAAATQDAIFRMNTGQDGNLLVDGTIVEGIAVGDEPPPEEIVDVDVDAELPEPEALGDAELLAYVQ